MTPASYAPASSQCRLGRGPAGFCRAPSGQGRTGPARSYWLEQLETSVRSDKSEGNATVVPDSDEEDDMFAFGLTQAVNDTDDEAFGPTQAVNETVEEPLATQAVDETVDDTITDEKNDESSDQQELLGVEMPEIDFNNTKSLFEEGLFKIVDTADPNVLFNKAKPDIVQVRGRSSWCFHPSNKSS